MTLKEKVIRELGKDKFDKLPKNVKTEIKDMDELRKISSENGVALSKSIIESKSK